MYYGEMASAECPVNGVNNDSVKPMINQIKENNLQAQEELKNILRFLDSEIPEMPERENTMKEPDCLLHDLKRMLDISFGINSQIGMVKERLGM